ncbi:SEFIR domain-containing protein [Chitinophaga terrae (ex Kim and Jung 2007)]|uniref:SEFIR domain-containing protein n=1 Tax=Chitinophaga terrae (ex Kim and Jung 2007) TaxID=408074 RepID=A0A1H4GQB1_9BACT|nr:SEFIR domain-containing protein [Chitinophaga terrae (ex Kim and Jung 2007)]GEP93666.1 hypothetical protein CTE07_53110 [Chitinophaga terrae (ex Kim and Jung 2007)]SEB11734.1 SEFIR domain-containing protein [Chitinophaga terrae (ex Kim and Jung 2007)]
MNLKQVFISYAHENDAYRNEVREFVEWLRVEGKGVVKVVCDFDHEKKAPKQGWPVWMEDMIEESDIVLLLCTPLYLKRFRKKEEPGKGAGVTFEGAIITQDLYSANMVNNKFVPIIPDTGHHNHIPKMLLAFNNGFKFPSNQDKILECILLDDSTVTDSPEPNDHNCIVTSAEIEEVGREIAKEIISTVHEEPANMSKIEILVRAFLRLSESQKLMIAKQLEIFEDRFITLSSKELTQEVFRRAREKSLLAELWDNVNKMNSFGNNNNPFKA